MPRCCRKKKHNINTGIIVDLRPEQQTTAVQSRTTFFDNSIDYRLQLELLKGTTMSLPTWVENEEDEAMFGKAAGLGADNVVLLSKVAAGAFIAAKESAGKF